MAFFGTRTINLALQGGGAHGAFTWGVLDRLLEDERVRIEALSGTSAGAMNAVVLASGFASGGREGARRSLGRFWGEISGGSAAATLGLSPFDAMFQRWGPPASVMFRVFDAVSRFVSPYQANPFNVNPLRRTLERTVDFERIRRCGEVKLFVSATNVRTGQQRIFRNPELSVDAVLASACLPLLFHAVEIDGEAYWDGGYTSNPALLPLVAESHPDDLVLIQINPLERPSVPRTAHAIADRINEISFNSSLDQELRTIALIKRLLQSEQTQGYEFKERRFRKIASLRLHRIEAHKEMSGLGASTKLSTDRGLVQRLHDIGYAAAGDWLRDNFRHLGRRSTIDLFPDPGEPRSATRRTR